MATKKSEKVYQKTVQCPVTPDMVEQITYYETNTQKLLEKMLSLANGGYQVSFRTSFKPEGVSASLMPQEASLPNAGLMLYGNSDNALSALAVLIAKVDFLGLNTDWTESEAENNGRRYS